MRANVGLALSAALVVAIFSSTVSANQPVSEALVNYINNGDDSFTWEERRQGEVNGVSFTELLMTSQTWKDITWKHLLYVLVPPNVERDVQHGMLYVTGGSWQEAFARPSQSSDPLPREAGLFATLARQMRTPVAVLLHVPHQPILGGKYEDQIIAYTFEKYLETGDAEWPLLLPMVKATVRAMDAVQQYTEQSLSVNLESFTVTGASKRGWTTWLTGAVDSRATVIAPMVIDMLNIRPQMEHQLQVWGDYSPEIGDYTQRNLQEQLTTDQGERLRRIVDPFAYLDQLQQTKLIIIGTNDRYWPLDALNLYWNQLGGAKHVLYVPNNGHGLNDLVRLTGTLSALHEHAAFGRPLPNLQWQFEDQDNGSLKLSLRGDQPPTTVNAWVATAPERDFRASSWRSFPFHKEGDAFVYRLETPEQGYVALFGEVTYAPEERLPFFLSTNVRILGPDGPVGPDPQ